MEIVSSIDRTQNFKHKQLDLHGLFKVLNFSQFPKNMVNHSKQGIKTMDNFYYQ